MLNIYKLVETIHHVSTNSKSTLDIERKAFTETDQDLLTYELIPRNNKNVLYTCLIFLAIIPLLPFWPASITHKTLIQTMPYEKAFAVSCFLIGLLMLGVYYFRIICLKRDIAEGHKYLYRTQVLKKIWKGNHKFELVLVDRPKNVSKKIILPKEEFYKWFGQDELEIEYLKRTGDILTYRKITL